MEEFKDDFDINNLKEWKNSIGYIPQETQLLNTSIKNNIAFGIDDEDINEDKLKNSNILKSFYFFFLKTKQTPLLQYLFPVGFGPSSNMCP